MTFQGEPTPSNSSALKALVVLAIVLIAYWASNGGLASIDVPGYVPPTTTTTTAPQASTTSIPTVATTQPLPVTPTTIITGTTVAG